MDRKLRLRLKKLPSEIFTNNSVNLRRLAFFYFQQTAQEIGYYVSVAERTRSKTMQKAIEGLQTGEPPPKSVRRSNQISAPSAAASCAPTSPGLVKSEVTTGKSTKSTPEPLPKTSNDPGGVPPLTGRLAEVILEPKQGTFSDTNVSLQTATFTESITEPEPKASSHHAVSLSLGAFDINKAPRLYEISDDEDLPDLDEPLGLQRCTCQKTNGRTVLMCQNCRLSPEFGEPATKRAKKHRHFLDVISKSKDSGDDDVFRVKEEDSEEKGYDSDISLESICSTSRNLKDSIDTLESEISSEKVQPKNQKLDSSLTSVDSDLEIEEKPVLSRLVHGKTKNLVKPEPPHESRSVTHKLRTRPPHFPLPVHSQVIFGEKEEEDLKWVVKMNESRLNIIKGVQEEALACSGLLPLVTKLISEYTTASCEPPDSLIRFMFDILHKNEDIQLAYSLFNVLEKIIQIHPPMGTIPLLWSDLEDVINQLRLPYGIRNIPAAVALSNILALQVICSYLEVELLQRSLGSQIRVIRSVAYKWLSAELNFGHVKQIIRWITQALSYGEYEDVFRCLKKLPGSTKETPKPHVLPNLQKLLDLSISVSKRPEDCARRISVELVHMFRCLPSLGAKKLFFSTLESPLLKFTLSQRILEDQYGAESGGAQCLQDIIQADFCIEPPRTSLTPPPTPSDDDEEEEPRERNRPAFHDEGWEELLLLLWTVVSSYLSIVKGKLKYPVWKRVLEPSSNELSLKDLTTVKDLPQLVARLRKRISSTSTQVSLYLVKLECLADAA